ncbi:MAG: response regulator [Planctomycetaceae bacterium]|nr:response regulator [Planctomycetaceae bacterium]
MEAETASNLIILVAEDDRGHFALVKKNLWRTCVDAEIIRFPDGQQLLEFLKSQSPSGETFVKGKYLLLLDIKMPGMNGIEVLSILRQDPGLKKMPVIMLTTTNNPQEVEHCYEIGCSFYVVKPSDYSSFMEAIEHLGHFLSLTCIEFPILDPALVFHTAR